MSPLPVRPRKRLQVVLLASALTAATALLAVPPAGAAGNFAFLRCWGSKWVSDYRPAGVALDSSGNLYAVDQDNCRVIHFAARGGVLHRWGSYGTGNGQFLSPWGVAVDSSDNVYVTDVTGDRVQKFTSSGAFIRSWGTSGTGSGQFDRPEGVAVDSSNGNVYVAEFGNCRIQKFSADGAVLAKWDNGGVVGSHYNNLGAIAVGKDGYVYVSDWYGSAVLKLNKNGELQRSFNCTGTLGSDAWPAGVAADAAGNVFVAVNTKNCVLKFKADGTLLATFSSAGSGDGQLRTPTGLARDGAGNLYLGDSMNFRLQKLDKLGAFVSRWPCHDEGLGKFSGPHGMAVDGSGVVYVADCSNNRVQRFSADGSVLGKLGSRGSGDGQMLWPEDLAFDLSGNLLVADAGNNRLQKFSAAGAFLGKWGATGAGNGEFHYPVGVTVDDDGNIYVSDSGWGFYVSSNDRVQKFSSSGGYVLQWGTSGTGTGQFDWPLGLTAGGDGDITVVDGKNDRIQQFTSTGAFVRAFGSSGTANGQFDEPQDVACDAAGNLYVADSGNRRVQVFSSTGAFLGKFGGFGTGNGQFQSVSGLALAADGTVYVSDATLNRVSAFVPGDPPAVVSRQPRGTGVATSSDLVMRFSVPMSRASVQSNLYLNNMKVSGGAFTWVGNKLTYSPAADLLPGKRYQVRITTGARAKTGVPLAADAIWNFTTAGTAPALVTAAAVPAGAGIQLSLTLSAPAEVTVTVRNLAGRPVALLRPGRLAAGVHAVSWSGTAAVGTRAPVGQYMLEAFAGTAGGDCSRALATARLLPLR